MERELWQYLKKAEKPILLYGMGNGADKIINVLNENNIEFQGVFASDGFVRDKYFHSKKLISYSEAKEKFGDMIVLLCFGSARDDVRQNVLKIASEQELYAPEVPVVGTGLFDLDYYNQNKAEFEKIYNRLADDLSKKTFLNIIKYKISGKIEYLLDCEADENEPYDTFLHLSKKESFLDLGAYTGDTVADFVARVEDYNEIIAVEPDIKNFKKLSLNTKDLKNITLYNAGISDSVRLGMFSMCGGRNSTSDKGKTEIEFLSVDEICKGKNITYIKMDVEGEEENAILGASETILKSKPKMLVSAYHKTDDFLSLPKAVLKLRDDYKIYVRHFKSLPAWDTNFYFV